MKVALYARVSTEGQTCENQLIELRQYAKAHPEHEYEEHQETLSSRKTRPVKEELLRRLRLGLLSGVAFVSLSRWGRSTAELCSELPELAALKRHVVSLKEGLDLSTAAGRATLGFLAVMAEFERDLTLERTLAGLARVRAQGKRLGPPKGNQNARKHPKQTPPGNPAPLLMKDEPGNERAFVSSVVVANSPVASKVVQSSKGDRP